VAHDACFPAGLLVGLESIGTNSQYGGKILIQLAICKKTSIVLIRSPDSHLDGKATTATVPIGFRFSAFRLV